MNTYNPDFLKPLANIFEPDPRQKCFVILDSKSHREQTLEDYYSFITEVSLNDYVPEKIRIHFETTRNLFIYAWFVFRFSSVAELHAYASVEFALKEKAMLCIDTTKKYYKTNYFEKRYKQHEKKNFEECFKKDFEKCFMLARLLHMAKEEGWIKDEGFRDYMRIKKNREHFLNINAEIFNLKPIQPEIEESEKYCKILCETLPFLRNSLAHGSQNLDHVSSYKTLRICADLINQLFDRN